jgi:hypothetical protein
VRVQRSWFTRKAKAVWCDRCDRTSKTTLSWHLLCDRCLALSSSLVRREYFRRIDQSFLSASAVDAQCSLCVSRQPVTSLYLVCEDCTSAHPDATHRRLFDWDSERVDGISFGWCVACGGIRVREGSWPDKHSYKYYVVGHREPILDPPVCDGDVMERDAREKECVHDWLTIYSTVNSPGEAERIRRSFYGAHPVVRELISNDPEDVAAGVDWVAAGANFLWCTRCGLHYRFTPAMTRRLPIRGVLEPRQ